MGPGLRFEPDPAQSCAARARGVSRRTIPRFVFDFVHRRVASTASRIVVPSGRAPAPDNGPPIAAALARKSRYELSSNDAIGDTFPGLDAVTSSRHASCAAAAISAAAIPPHTGSTRSTRVMLTWAPLTPQS